MINTLKILIQKDDQEKKENKPKKTDAVQPDDEEDVEEEEVEIDAADLEPTSNSRPASKLDLEEPASSVDEGDEIDDEVHFLQYFLIFDS